MISHAAGLLRSVDVSQEAGAREPTDREQYNVHMNFLDRESVCEKLRLSKWQSYNFFDANKLHMVREADALALLNGSRVKINEAFRYIPELITTDELSATTGVPSSRISTWTRRTKNPIPHIRFNSHTIRFYRAAAEAWLERMSK